MMTATHDENDDELPRYVLKAQSMTSQAITTTAADRAVEPTRKQRFLIVWLRMKLWQTMIAAKRFLEG